MLVKTTEHFRIERRIGFRINKKTPLLWMLLSIFFLISGATAHGASPAGYSEYFIPGDEDLMNIIFYALDQDPGDDIQNSDMFASITVTAWSGNTTVYYDHWEDGYDFDPDDPSTADETVTLTLRGDSYTFEDTNIPLPSSSVVDCSTGTCYYGGRDRIYVAGGTTTVTRASWTDSVGSTFAVAWEVYPVRPQLTTYILPFGEDLAGTPNLQDFERVFALIQATNDGTVVEVDLDGGATWDPDTLDWTRDGTGDGTQVSLDAGEVFLLDDVSAMTTLSTGTVVKANDTLQVQYIIGDAGARFEIRGLSAFPRGFWDDEYYAPVDSDTGTNGPTDLYLYNPHTSDLTIEYETTSGSGSFTITAGEAASFQAKTSSYVPENSAVYLKGNDVFWGISTVDTENVVYDWGYSLVPAFLLENEHFMGWAPGAYPANTTGNEDDSGIFIAPAQDNIRVFIDRDNDGNPDATNGTYDLDRLETQYVYDATDGDMSEANIWATGPYTVAYGQNPDTAVTGLPAIDVGYTTIPGVDFIDLVLTVDVSTSPVIVSTTTGSQATYTITVNTHDFTVDDINISDVLPDGWSYVDDSTTISFADNTEKTGNDANPTSGGTGPTLTWDLDAIEVGQGDLAANQTVTITFTAEIDGTVTFADGDIPRNVAQAMGTRTVQGADQTFVTSDFTFNSFGDPTDLQVSKTSGATDPLYPGDQFTYTVELSTNDSLSGIAIYDALPDGVSYVAGTSQVVLSDLEVGDIFSTAAYDNNDGKQDWNGSWTEYQDDGSATSGNVLITSGELVLDDRPNSGGAPGAYRSVDLTGASSATFSFDYRAGDRVDTVDAISVYVYDGDTTTWTLLETITGFSGSTSGSKSYDISGYVSDDTRVEIMVSAGYGDNREKFYVDNFFVTASPITKSAGDPPNFVTKNDNYNLGSGQTLTLTFDVAVDDPLATGIDEITNTASVTSNEFLLPTSDNATNIVVNPSSESAEVGGQVWLDADGDGVQDLGEAGLSNVEVTLKDEFGTPIATAVTDISGNYIFTDVAPGSDYYVEVTAGLPSGLEQSAPAGHSDDRTDPFDLVVGQSKTDAVLGYKTAAGTATIGDTVWSDADGNGVRDSGEPGLSGVTVVLYLDDGDGLLEPGTDDTLSQSTSTAADGSYLFTGVVASGTEDYFVFVDETQTALTDYDPSTSASLDAFDVDAGDALMNYDFGFIQQASGTTWSITDQVWFDKNDDDTVDSGEGISGVTVDLLDSSNNVIATTTTTADGTFTFSGVPGNSADYTLQITDTAGVLDDYYGISAAALAGEAAVNDLTGIVDNTSPGPPSFEYGLSRSVQGTVFNDSGGTSGTQDTGEPGISEVTVELYLDDGDGTFEPGSDDTLITSLTTDSDGNYLFSGLDDGSYWVDIDQNQSTLSGYDTLTTTDYDGNSANGHQQLVSISGGVSAIDKDFGYQVASSPNTITGTVLDDADGDGQADVGETGLEDVTVELLQGTTVVATATTDSNGDYTFSGLPDGTYTVRITDENSIIDNYDTTYEETEGALAGSYDNEESISVASGQTQTVAFRYNKPVPTLVGLSAFKAFVDNGQVVVHWETGFESGTIGFYLYRKADSGGYLQINDDILPGLLVSPQGGTYQYVDDGAETDTYTYLLVEVEASGDQRIYGPFTITVGDGGYTYSSDKNVSRVDDLFYGYGRTAHEISETKKLRTASAKALRSETKSEKKKRAKSTAKLFVSEPGLYYLDAEEIGDLLGVTSETVQTWIGKKKLSLKRQGEKAAWLAAKDNSGVYFYGEAVDSIYTDQNVYWIKKGSAKVMKTVEQAETVPTDGDETFTETVHLEENNWALTTLYDDPEADYWHWDYVFSGYSGMDEKSFTIRADGVDQGAESATLTVRLRGATDTDADPDHHVFIRINGTEIGESYWNGTDTQEVTVEFNPALLEDGKNTIELTGVLDTGAAYSLFYVDAFDLTYQRFYRAYKSALYAPADGNDRFTISGFTDPDVRVFDVTKPRKAKLVEASVHEEIDGDYSVTIAPKTSGKIYFAVAADAVMSVKDAWADESSSLSSKRNRADYLVIAPSELKDGAEALADHRENQGLETMVVDLEDIMDEFNDGLFSPEAVRSFLSHAYSSWEKHPVYVVLVGEGTYDYKDNQGYGDNLMPVMMVSTSDGLYASDNRYVDVSGGDGIPEMAVGRLPVLDNDELYAAIDKITTYESADGDWTRKVLMLADNPDGGGYFESDSDAVAALLPSGYTVEKIYLSGLSTDDARQQVLDGINDGALIVNYIGHGAVDRLAQEGLLVTDDVDDLTNGERLPILTAMTCVVGQFAIPGYDALSEALVLHEGGGVIAVVAPTGLSLNAQARILNEEFFYSAFEYDEARLGDVVVKAVEFYNTRGDGSIIDLYNLQGDPALRMK
jgi:uncharacterized repeat protein (TIGR01451 family)